VHVDFGNVNNSSLARQTKRFIGPQIDELMAHPIGTQFRSLRYARVKNKTCIRILEWEAVYNETFLFKLLVDRHTGKLIIYNLHEAPTLPGMIVGRISGNLAQMARLPLGTVFSSNEYHYKTITLLSRSCLELCVDNYTVHTPYHHSLSK